MNNSEKDAIRDMARKSDKETIRKLIHELEASVAEVNAKVDRCVEIVEEIRKGIRGGQE
jgi:hypothetical protein